METIQEFQSNLEERDNLSTLKYDVLSGTDLYIFSHQQHNSQMKQVRFLQYWNQQSTSRSSPQCLFRQIQVQKPTLDFGLNQRLDHA